MARVTRRFFLLSCAAWSAGCATQPPGASVSPAAKIRAPTVGQSWRYAKRDLYTHAVIKEEVDRVASIDRYIKIDSGEVQGPWGMVLADPHWGQIQVYETPVPLWPVQLQPGWQTRIKTQYKTATNGEGLHWNQTMKASAWETVTVPAGRFTALKFTNSIEFGCGDFARKDCRRRETLWFAPEVGRWVARESSGSYYADNSASDRSVPEGGFRWELIEWSAAAAR
jgi:hypothetical protein